MGAVDVLYERFEKNLQAVNGNSWLADKAEAAGIIAQAYKEEGVDSVCIAESPLLQEIGLAKALADAGMEVYTDHLRLHAETAKGGVLEALLEELDSNFVRMIDFTALGLFDGTIIPHYEPENLELYIQNTEKHILNRYLRILSVSNHDVVVIEDGKVMR